MLNKPNIRAKTKKIIASTESITLIIPSHMPILAKVNPACGDLPALISLISFFPMIHAGIAARIPQEIKDKIPSTNAMIALELAPPPVFIEPGGTGGGGGLKLGGGGGGGGKFPLPESVLKSE